MHPIMHPKVVARKEDGGKAVVVSYLFVAVKGRLRYALL